MIRFLPKRAPRMTHLALEKLQACTVDCDWRSVFTNIVLEEVYLPTASGHVGELVLGPVL